MNKRYYWLKLKNDFFKDKRIKKLRKIAGGDTYTIIYLKMQLLSLQDEGLLYYDGVEETFEEEIALQIDEDVEDVKITIGFLLRHGLLIQDENNEYQLPETINSIGSETASTIRSRKSREKIKALQCNTDATKCNTEIDIEKDIDIDNNNNNIYDFLQENGFVLSPIHYETVSQWEDNELTRYAIKQAVGNNIYKIKYIDRILYSYKKDNIKTVQQAIEREEDFNNKRDKYYKNKYNIKESRQDKEKRIMEEWAKDEKE